VNSAPGLAISYLDKSELNKLMMKTLAYFSQQSVMREERFMSLESGEERDKCFGIKLVSKVCNEILAYPKISKPQNIFQFFPPIFCKKISKLVIMRFDA